MCSLSFSHCPGHFGHIQLALPIFNPAFFGEAVVLLKSLCFNCHKLRCSTRDKRILLVTSL